MKRKKFIYPQKAIVHVIAEVQEGKFIPDRENDELTKALGNPEKSGRTRGFGPSVPWKTGFPEDRESYRSRARAKKRQVEEQKKMFSEFQRKLDQQQRQIEELTGGRQLVENTTGTSQRQSIVADLEVPAADDARMIDGGPGYPVDGIKASHLVISIRSSRI